MYSLLLYVKQIYTDYSVLVLKTHLYTLFSIGRCMGGVVHTNYSAFLYVRIIHLHRISPSIQTYKRVGAPKQT